MVELQGVARQGVEAPSCCAVSYRPIDDSTADCGAMRQAQAPPAPGVPRQTYPSGLNLTAERRSKATSTVLDQPAAPSSAHAGGAAPIGLPPSPAGMPRTLHRAPASPSRLRQYGIVLILSCSGGSLRRRTLRALRNQDGGRSAHDGAVPACGPRGRNSWDVHALRLDLTRHHGHAHDDD
jgi:hypothetical protein